AAGRPRSPPAASPGSSAAGAGRCRRAWGLPAITESGSRAVTRLAKPAAFGVSPSCGPPPDCPTARLPDCPTARLLLAQRDVPEEPVGRVDVALDLLANGAQQEVVAALDEGHLLIDQLLVVVDHLLQLARAALGGHRADEP